MKILPSAATLTSVRALSEVIGSASAHVALRSCRMGTRHTFEAVRPRLSASLVPSLPWHPLHRDEMESLGFLDRNHVYDVGVIESSDRFRFLLEAAKSIARGGLNRQYFQRDFAAELLVLGEVHVPHPTASDLFQDLVVGEGTSDHALPYCNSALNRSLKVPCVCARCCVRKPMRTTVPSPSFADTIAALLARCFSPMSQPLCRTSRSM